MSLFNIFMLFVAKIHISCLLSVFAVDIFYVDSSSFYFMTVFEAWWRGWASSGRRFPKAKSRLASVRSRLGKNMIRLLKNNLTIFENNLTLFWNNLILFFNNLTIFFTGRLLKFTSSIIELTDCLEKFTETVGNDIATNCITIQPSKLKTSNIPSKTDIKPCSYTYIAQPSTAL